ncbi:hypothetical protein [Deinococcus altitudinis]|uniref:hypothetical protein n=1 Tax=Deinococcus altitudinis TaxID=468914 RepID=UPI0038926B5E
MNGESSELTDEEAEFLFGGQDDNVTDLDQVPAGAGAVAIVTEANEGHDPETTRAVLTPNLGGQKKLNILMEEVPPGMVAIGKTRRAWITEISPKRAEELVNEARQNKVAHPWTAITELLDQEVGARIKRSTVSASTASNRNAMNVTKPGQKLTAPPDEPLKFVPGSEWREKESGIVLTLQEIVRTKNRNGGGMAYLMSNGKTATGLDLTLKFEAV